MTKLNNYLVTGANGFIGKQLCSQLQQQGHHVTAIIRNPANATGPWDEHIIADLTNDTLPEQALENIDAIFHLAAITHTTNVSWHACWQLNVMATAKLLKLAIKNNVKAFLYLSSIKAVAANNSCITEKDNAWPKDNYGISKRKAEEIILQQAPNHMHTCILRPALVYGPNAKGNLASMERAIKSGWFPPIPEINNKRSMLHIDDLINAMLMAINNPKANKKIFIVSDNNHYSTRQVYNAMRDKLKLPAIKWSIPVSIIKFIAKLGDLLEAIIKIKMPINSTVIDKLLGSAWFSSHAIQQELNWRPKQSF